MSRKESSYMKKNTKKKMKRKERIDDIEMEGNLAKKNSTIESSDGKRNSKSYFLYVDCSTHHDHGNFLGGSSNQPLVI